MSATVPPTTQAQDGKDVMERVMDEPETVYDPTLPKKINNKEWWIERIDPLSGEPETYAGAWPRAMLENARYEPRQNIWLGVSENSGREFGVPFGKMFTHMAFLGSTGTGKTNALYNVAYQIMEAGHGIAIVDPKGDDVYSLLRRIPDHRREDLVYVDLAADYLECEHPDPDVDEEVPFQTGFNIFNTYHDPDEPGFDPEIEWIVSDMVQLLAAGEFWGNRMDRIAKNMIRAMARHEDEFTPIEMYYALINEDNRNQYGEIVGTSVDDEDIMFLSGYAEVIANELDESDFDSLLGRLKDWVEDPITRRVVAQKGAGVTLGQIVNEQKILIVNNDLPEEAKVMVADAIKSGIWTAVIERKSAVEKRFMELAGVEDIGSEYKPFFLAIDEAHSVFTNADEIEKMLMEARSKKLGLLLSTQQLRSLPDNAADAMIANCNTILAMKPNHPAEAGEIAERFGGMDKSNLQKVPDYHATTQLRDDSDPFLARLTPPFPPIRSVREAYELVLESLERYGSPMLSGAEILDDMHFDSGVHGPAMADTGDPENVDLLGSDERRREALKLIYDAGIKTGEYAEASATDADTAVSLLAERFNLGHTQPDNVLERLVSTELLTWTREDQDMRVKLTTDGLELLGLDTGSGGSGGGKLHRYLLRRLYIAFTRLGYEMELPDQDAPGKLPDAVASLPSILDDLSLGEANRVLREEYPALYALSGDMPLHIEAECDGLTSPERPINNAAKYDGPIMFAVADGGSDGYCANARRLTEIFTEPPWTNPRPPSDPDVDRLFYTGSVLSATASGDGEESLTSGTYYAAHPDPDIGRVQPVELSDGSIEFRANKTGEAVATFDGVAEYIDRDRGDWAATTHYDSDRNAYVIEWVDENGERRERRYGDQSSLTANCTLVYEPAIPEVMFGGDVPPVEAITSVGKSHGPPDRDCYRIAIVPNDETELPAVYLPDDDSAIPIDQYLEESAGISVSMEADPEQHTDEIEQEPDPDTHPTPDETPESTDDMSLTERLNEMGLGDSMTD